MTEINNPLSCILLDDNHDRRSLLSRSIAEIGFNVKVTLKQYDELLINIENHPCDFLIVGVDIPSQELLCSLKFIHTHNPKPVIMFAEKDTPNIIKKTIDAGVNAYIVDDLQPKRLSSIINIALARFQTHQHLVQELNETKNKLEQRKILDKAKGILMQQKNITEQDAYALIRKMAMDKGEKLEKVAQNIIDVFTMLG
ncbi:ANTAR domain-containing response regulator [Marinicellulosiphila megalodicopiae]|uniref:ANTAR domain-containing response regulator n=1 Tax=Marinicellulosiphila megalodicopiae TaxID=2724896 RepID=UPI003BB17660